MRWHTWGFQEEPEMGFLGHNMTNFKISSADTWYVPDYEIEDFSIGAFHTLVLSKHKFTGKKDLFVIGSNGMKTFGFQTEVTHAVNPLKVKFADPNFPIDKITRVLAREANR